MTAPSTPAFPTAAPAVRRDDRHPLDAIFHPTSIAVIGATEKPGSVGRTILWNLLSSPFGGTVYPVNPTRPAILGVKAYPSIAAIGEPVDLAVIVTPAKTAPQLVADCGEAGVTGVIIISAGFKEVGAEGAELERQVLEAARRYGIRVVGPNCLGVMNPIERMNATFAAGIANPGRVGFVSQSGALLTAILDWSTRENVGFSAIVSLGSMLDVGWGDVIDYLGDDPNTDSIVIYMETIGDARAFLSAAREVAMTKPIIVIKPGRTEQAAKAAASHTGSLTGSDDVLDAAFRRAGVLRVDSISELFEVSEILAKQPRPRGRKLSIVTNAGGPGVIATDALIGGGGQLTELSPETMDALNAVLPAVWSHNNPIDIIGDAPPERYAKALEVAAADPSSDGLLVILTPQAMTDPTETARALVRHARIQGKPVLASWMGGADVEEGARILSEAGIPTFAYPDTACVLFNHLWRYGDNLRSLYETPALPAAPERGEAREDVDRIIAAVAAEGRTLLTEYESKKVLAAYGIPISDTEVAATSDEAVAAADEMGYPVVAKLLSRTITHKTDVGGVVLNLRDADAVREAFDQIRSAVADKAGVEHFEGVTIQPMINWTGYELIVGSSPGPAVRPGAAVRDGRAAGRGVPRSGARAAAAQHDAGPPPDPRDDHLRRAGRCAWSPADRRGRDRGAAGALQRARGGAAADRRDRHQPVARVAGADHRAGRAGGAAPRLRRRCRSAAARDPAVPARVPAQTRDRGWGVARRPAHPPRGRAGGRPLPRRPVPGDGPRAIRHRPFARRADGARAAGADLLRRLRPPVRAGCGGHRCGRCHRGRGGRAHLSRAGLRRPGADAGGGGHVAAAGVGAALVRSAVEVARGEGVAHLLAELSPDNRPMRELLAASGFTLEERGEVLLASLAAG